MKRFGAILCMALLGAAVVHADVIFNNFAAGNGYSTGGAWDISGPTSVDGEQLVTAMPFTPSADYTLDSITVGIGSFSGTNSLDLALYDDAGGVPGSALESWSGIAMTGPVFTSGVVETVTDSTNLSLTSGTQYWVVASAGADDTYALWGWNSTGDIGTRMMDTNGAGWSGFTGTLGAFSVTGTPLATPSVPEPATCALFALGLVGLVRRRRKV